jgi:hypothetical protein
MLARGSKNRAYGEEGRGMTIDRTALPNVSDTLRRLGVEPKQRRSKCPIHRGYNAQALSFNDEDGVWYCHRCGKGGDVVALVQQALDTDFPGALRWFGIEPGQPPKPDPAIAERTRTREALRLVVTKKARELRKAYRERWEFERASMELLLVDPENEIGWELLRKAYLNEPRDEYDLEQIDMCKTDEDFERALNYLMAMEAKK